MNRKILIIDDDTEYSYLVSKILSDKNHTIFSAETIEAGLALLKEKNPEVVFLDNQLPDGLGWEKAEFILANYPNTQLNLISALDVPKTSTSSFRIIEKQQLLEELKNNF